MNVPNLPSSCPCCSPVAPGTLWVSSEADRLRSCLVHHPGRELSRLTPSNYQWHMFDDLLDPKTAKEEHDRLVQVLRVLGVEVHSFKDLLQGVFERMSAPDRREFLTRVREIHPGTSQFVFNRLEEMEGARVVQALIEGVAAEGSFAAEVEDVAYFVEPMANLLFMQDIAAVVGKKIVQGYMAHLVRLKEEVVMEEILRHHEVFGPSGSAKLWMDPEFRGRHRMARKVYDYLRVEAARVSLNIKSLALSPEEEAVDRDASSLKLVLELEDAYLAAGPHFTVEGGNILTLGGRSALGERKMVALLAHNARTSADAIDELAYRLLRPVSKDKGSPVGAVLVVDFQDPEERAGHLDTRVMVIGPSLLLVDRTLVEPPDGPGARFYVMHLGQKASPPALAEGDEVTIPLKVTMEKMSGLEEALSTAFRVSQLQEEPPEVRFVPPWDLWKGPEEGTPDHESGVHPTERWVQIQQRVWANALNTLTVAPGVLLGFERHRKFYEDKTIGLGATCIASEALLDPGGRFGGKSCCSLLSVVRDEAREGGTVMILVPGDELSRAQGGPRSLVMPLLRLNNGEEVP